MLGLVTFLITLGVIVTLHELGHLIAAKAFNIYCREFAIGMGPKLFSKQFKETEYSLRALPVGGYVAMAGEPDEDEHLPKNLPKDRTLPGIHPLKRIIIYLAGIIMNIFLFIVCFTIFFNAVGIDNPKAPESRVVNTIAESSPAFEAGILPGDELIQVITEDQTYQINSYDDLSKITLLENQEVTYVLKRDNQKHSFTLTPMKDEASNRYIVGVSFEIPRQRLNIIESFTHTLGFMVTFSVMIFKALGNLFIGRGLDQLGGPVRIYQETAKVAELGIIPILAWIGQLSLNVGLFNALPIPALDGGRVLLTFIELIIGRPVSKEWEARLIGGSFLILLGFILLVILNDLFHIF